MEAAMGMETSTAGTERCGARTRGGHLCRKYPIRWRQRCHVHGGANGAGAPRGNRNALKHGRTTAAALGARRTIMRLIRESEKTLEQMSGYESKEEQRESPQDASSIAAMLSDGSGLHALPSAVGRSGCPTVA